MKFIKRLSVLVLSTILFGVSATSVFAVTKSEIIGTNRYETAAKVADEMGGYETAILVNSDKSIADGLSAASLAGKENAPILLVKEKSIPNATSNRLQNVKRVYIIGGNSAISSKVEDELKDKEVIRIKGKNRIETSENVAKIVGNYNEAFIVNGEKGEADAMSVASVAARDQAPIILTNGKTSKEHEKQGVTYYAIGGENVVSSKLASQFHATRLYGNDRYKTNREVVKKFYGNSHKLYYTKGDILVDALTVSSLAKSDGILLVSKNSDNSVLLKEDDIVQVGGMDLKIKMNGKDNLVVVSKEYLNEYRMEFYKLINKHRREHGKSSLKVDPGLERWSYLKSKHMSDLVYFHHYYDGKLIDKIYPNAGGKIKLAGENIFWISGGNMSAKELAKISFKAWKESPSHNENMLRGNFKYMGVSAYSEEDGIYMTTDFGR